ncbi:MAG: ferrous iron transport protein B [Methylacidiphilales bacterium]|nr:ferrous iron transport protein B [Candidatus Methylacidiphilales bacterium]NJR14818.1 ferrous iron transport protein B [Calothrix sp. CSU_2_0]
MVLLLNMADEAPKFGVSIDHVKIGEHLGIPVVPICAKHGQGCSEAYKVIGDELAKSRAAISVGNIEACLPPEQEIASQMGALLQDAVRVPSQMGQNLTTRLDRILLHPVLGLPIFFSAMYLMFQFIYTLGTPLQENLGNLLTWFKEVALQPLLGGLLSLGVWGKFFHDFLIDGLYDGIGTVAAFIPVIFLFFICMAIVEDSGYLSRSAYLMDAFMEKLGLDGRSFVMSLMGFGCNVPAIMGLRAMRSPGLRMLSMLVIPFSLCSARLNVFIFITTALFAAKQAPLVLFSLYLFSFVAAILTAALFKGKFPSKEPLILELPPYRFPTFKQMMLRSWREVMHFLVWSRRFIILGVVAIWFCNNFPTNVAPASSGTLSGMIGQFASPIFAPIGINPQLTVSLLFGFIAKEIVLGGLAVIYATSEDSLGKAKLARRKSFAQQIDWVQAYRFMLFTLLYVPCLSTVAVIKSESKSIKFAMFSVPWSVGLAWLASFIFYQGARLLGF